MTGDIRLKIARLERGQRQADVAVAVGIPESYFAKIEQRRITPPRDLQEKIAAALGKQRWEIFR